MKLYDGKKNMSLNDVLVFQVVSFDMSYTNLHMKRTYKISFTGFPNYILNPDQLDDKYKDLDIRQYEYFENNLRVNQYNLRRNVEKLDQPVNKTRYNFISCVCGSKILLNLYKEHTYFSQNTLH
jgi:hypothetical protein